MSKSVAIGNLRLDAETYRSISMMAYHKGVPVEQMASEMLKGHLAIQGFLKNDFDIVHGEIIRTLANSIPDDKLLEEAKKLSPFFHTPLDLLHVRPPFIHSHLSQ